MSDSFSVTTSQSWFGRLFESIKSVLFGLVMFVLSFPLLFWNEGRAVRTARSLTEGLGAVVSVPAEAVTPGNEGKLVYVSGAVKTDKPVVDDELAVEADAVTLLRNVEMYQWKESESKETRKKLGGGKRDGDHVQLQAGMGEGSSRLRGFQGPLRARESSPFAVWNSRSFVADPCQGRRVHRCRRSRSTSSAEHPTSGSTRPPPRSSPERPAKSFVSMTASSTRARTLLRRSSVTCGSRSR